MLTLPPPPDSGYDMSMLYLIRHGQASFGQVNYDRLSPMGIEQAEVLGEHLLDIDVVPDAVYSGELSRQLDTAREVGARYGKRGVPFPEPVILSGLNEFDDRAIITSQLPDMQAEDPEIGEHLVRMIKDKESFKKVFEGAMLRWVSGDKDRPGAETWKEFTARVTGALSRIMEEHGKGKTVFAFTSGGPIAASLQFVLSLSPEKAIRHNWQIVNSSYTKYMYNAGRITMAGFNCTTHLEINQERSRLISYR
jgi:broad specificity phosphatase PhoE